MQVPEIRYARSGDLRIAYQTWGEGPRLLYVADLISHVEVAWEHELYRRSLEHIGRHLTMAWFDKRGIGMSDRFDEEPTLEQRNQDILAVMDALGWERAHICGQSEGGIMAQLFAADFPERVESVTLMNTVAPTRYYRRLPAHIRADDPPLLGGPEIYAHFERVLETWGEDATFQVEWELPGLAGDAAFERWIARLMRLAASPKDFKRQLDSIFELDAGDAPERITSPALVMHVQGDQVLPVAMGRLLAEIIPGARYVEIEGADHFPWVMPNWRGTTDTFIGFVTGEPVERSTSRAFATVLFTDIVDSTRRSAAVGDASWRETLDRHDRTARRVIDQHRGRVVKSTGDGLLAVFDLPGSGVACGIELCSSLRELGVEIRAGVHAGEIEVHDDGDVSGIAVNLAARVEQRAADGELWVSSTVRDLMLGGAVTFADRGEHELKGVDGVWRLFSVSPG